RLDAVSNTLEQKDQTLVGLIDQSQGVLRLVQERRSDIAGSLRAGNQLATELTRVVDVHKSQLDAILNVLHPTLDVIDKEQGKIDQGLSWVGSGSIGLSKAASHGPWQDVYVRSVGPDVLSILCGILGGTQPCV